jgi:hypothetical protein
VTNHEDPGTDPAVGRSDEPEQVRAGIGRAVEADLIGTEIPSRNANRRAARKFRRFGS